MELSPETFLASQRSEEGKMELSHETSHATRRSGGGNTIHHQHTACKLWGRAQLAWALSPATTSTLAYKCDC